jgi:quercetin dioxygenase-like cupin family protein
MMHKTGFQERRSLDWKEVDPGVERMIMAYDESMMMVQVRFRADSVGSLHSHPHIQSSYVAEGSFEVTIDGETRLLHEGDTFFVSSNLVHGVVCKEAGLLIDVFHPCREDFL